MEEIWKDIPGYENLYQASNIGRIKSIIGENKVGKRNIISVRRTRILKPTLTKLGYHRVTLSSIDKSRKTFQVHRLVAISFISNKEDKCHINHIN